MIAKPKAQLVASELVQINVLALHWEQVAVDVKYQPDTHFEQTELLMQVSHLGSVHTMDSMHVLFLNSTSYPFEHLRHTVVAALILQNWQFGWHWVQLNPPGAVV